MLSMVQNAAMPRPVKFAAVNRKQDQNPAQSSDQIIEKLSIYRKGLSSLVQWDKKQHKNNPVFLNLNIPELMRKANNFIQRQLSQDVSVPVPFLVGVSGGSASGKSTINNQWLDLFKSVSQKIKGWTQELNGNIVDEINLDHYYHDSFDKRKKIGETRFFSETNLDEPDALKMEQVQQDLTRLKNGKAVRIPVFSFLDSSSSLGEQLKVPSPFVITEGLFALSKAPIQKLYDMTVFIDASKKVRTDRWWKRAPERAIKNDKAGNALFNRVMDMHDQHIEPAKSQADIVINGTADLKQVRLGLKKLTELMVNVFYPV